MPRSDSEAPVEYIKVDFATSSDIVVVPTAGTDNATRKIRVLGWVLHAASAVTVKLQSGASTDLTGAMSFITGPNNAPYNPAGYCETLVGEKLNAVLGGAVQLSGTVVIQRVPTKTTAVANM